MQPEYAINQRIDAIFEKLSILINKRNEEMEKPFQKRDHRLLTFINKECKVYIYSLTQLRWLLSDNEEG